MLGSLFHIHIWSTHLVGRPAGRAGGRDGFLISYPLLSPGLMRASRVTIETPALEEGVIQSGVEGGVSGRRLGWLCWCVDRRVFLKTEGTPPPPKGGEGGGFSPAAGRGASQPLFFEPRDPPATFI